MRYMMIVKANSHYEDGAPPNPELMAEIAKDARQLMEAGVMIYTGGLAPSRDGVRLRARDGKLNQIDGPFAETTELVGGFAIFECKSKEEAIEYGRRFMGFHLRILGPAYQGELEIRQLFGFEEVHPL